MVGLDVGCGKNKRAEIGIDRFKFKGVDVVADMHCLPFRDSTFDKVISNNILEHSYNPKMLLDEQNRVLKPNGKIEITTDKAQYFSWSVFQHGFGGERHEDLYPDHYMIFYPKNAIRLMRIAGFKPATITFLQTKTKPTPLIMLLVLLHIFRKESLFFRFRVEGYKQK